jgi:hypothetical protein
MDVIGRLHVPAALQPGERAPSVHWTGSWVSPIDGLNTGEEKKNLLPPVGNQTPAIQPAAIPSSDSVIIPQNTPPFYAVHLTRVR